MSSTRRPHARGRRGPTWRAVSAGTRHLRSGIAVLLALVLAACTAASSPTTEATAVAALPRAERQRLVFDSVWTIVRREHVDSTLRGIDWDAARERLRERAARATDERSFYRVLGELLSPLHDAHTYATTPSAVAREQARRKAARDRGLGFQLLTLGGSVVVADVQPASAAGHAGVKPGWVVRSWNGIPVDSAALAAGRFGASRGDTVMVAFADTLDQLHEHVLVPVAYSWRHPRDVRRVDDVAVVRLTSFEPGMGAWFRKAVASHRSARGLVVDLRGNPGGQMVELTAALEALFPDRQPVGRFIDRRGRTGRLFLHDARRTAFDGPIAILVDRRSGSAAEIFAAVVQGAGRGRVVGERTAGAVLNAYPFRLPDGGRLHVSRRDFRDLCDVRLEHTGVAPLDTADAVRRTLDDVRRARDPALARAMDVVRDSALAASVPRRCDATP
jgi:carboxyl-terminal processing protease